MNKSSEEKAAELGDETLTRLGDAVGQPPASMAENAKALFSFLSAASGASDDNAASGAFEHNDVRTDDSVPVASAASSATADQARG
ncbi:hypothetical protein [Streptomyces zagrosensis]|uniref:Uncharacterized protein n=1 Tax=Streptomyces zagrosensis TaxID=1042984 RepID=A0A7W9V033_9ACTN|nr:hypothetical protein [Streptomyces zagrosensis]MBB5937713.1 hypothetical protein [Streptomyces zagrosensis]